MIFIFFLEAKLNFPLGDVVDLDQNSSETLQSKYTKFVASSRWDILKQCVTYLSQKPLSETRWECRIESVKCVRLEERKFQATLAETGNT